MNDAELREGRLEQEAKEILGKAWLLPLIIQPQYPRRELQRRRHFATGNSEIVQESLTAHLLFQLRIHDAAPKRATKLVRKSQGLQCRLVQYA